MFSALLDASDPRLDGKICQMYAILRRYFAATHSNGVQRRSHFGQYNGFGIIYALADVSEELGDAHVLAKKF